ncbi:MAG: heavy-metal-associated domain-containing protein [Dehalococcoidia bacterium]
MIKESILRIPAIHCGGCVTSVKRTLQALPGVGITDIDPTTKLARLTFDDSVLSLDRIRESLEEIGFSPDEQ